MFDDPRVMKPVNKPLQICMVEYSNTDSNAEGNDANLLHAKRVFAQLICAEFAKVRNSIRHDGQTGPINISGGLKIEIPFGGNEEVFLVSFVDIDKDARLHFVTDR